MKKRIFLLSNDKGRNLLHIAAFFCAEKIVDILCKEFKTLELPVDRKDNFGYSPAILVCIHKSETDSLISHGKGGDGSQVPSPTSKKAEDNSSDSEKITGFSRRTTILQKLSELSQSWKDASYVNTYNPLHWAIANGDQALSTYITKERPDFRRTEFYASF